MAFRSKFRGSRRLAIRLSVALVLGAIGGSALQAGPQPVAEAPVSLELWKDPRFQKEFLGSYGTNSEIEPRADDDEREQMRDIIPLLESDQLEAAATKIEAIRTAESSAVIDFTLANVYFQLDRLEPAIDAYRAALDKFPSFRRAHRNLALILVRENRYEEAIRPLTRVVELGGADGLTFGLLGYSYNATQQYLSAESAYRSALLLQPEVLDWRLGLTQSLMQQGRFPEVVTLCDELLRAQPDRTDLWVLQANAYIGLEKPLKAAQNLEFVHRLGGGTTASRYTLGDVYVNQELWDLAVRAYGQAVQSDAGQPVAPALARVDALAQRGALDPASTLLKTIRSTFGDRLNEKDRRRALKLGARIAAGTGDDAGSVAVLEEIVALDPLDGEALLLLAGHHGRAGDVDRAIFYYERAGSLDEHEAEAKVRQAQLLVNQARYADALPLLERAQELQPREDVARYKEQVERVARARR